MEWSEIFFELLKAYHLDSAYESITNTSFGVPSKTAILLSSVSERFHFFDTSYLHTDRFEDTAVSCGQSHVQHIFPSSLQIPRSCSR